MARSSIQQCAVAELLFIVNAIEINFEDTKEPQSREGTAHCKGCP